MFSRKPKSPEYITLDGGAAAPATTRIPQLGVDHEGRLSLAWRDTSKIDKQLAVEQGPRVRTLDLSHNTFRTFGFLRRFTQLRMSHLTISMFRNMPFFCNVCRF
jgi:hypothetical protein